MSGEVERGRFRAGESPNKPIGGNIADKPFPQTLHRLAASRGFDSQKSLARALGSSQNSVSSWYKDTSCPSSELLERVFVVLDLTDEERDSLVELYALRLERKNSEFLLKMSRKGIRRSDNPMGEWLESLCEEKGLTLAQGSEQLKSPDLLKRRRRLSLEDLDFISQNAKDAFDLSEEEQDILLETIEKEKQYGREKGRKFQRGPIGKQVVKEQEKLDYPTWNGAQAGAEVGRTRERIRQLRKKFGFPLLLTAEHMEQLKNYLAKTETIREQHRFGRIA